MFSVGARPKPPELSCERKLWREGTQEVMMAVPSMTLEEGNFSFGFYSLKRRGGSGMVRVAYWLRTLGMRFVHVGSSELVKCVRVTISATMAATTTRRDMKAAIISRRALSLS